MTTTEGIEERRARCGPSAGMLESLVLVDGLMDLEPDRAGPLSRPLFRRRAQRSRPIEVRCMESWVS